VYSSRVSKPSDHEQLDRVRERFTRTAEQFASFSLATRAEEAALLVRLAAPKGTERALDLACGPGTFTRVLAQHVRAAVALDLTPALMEQARTAIAKAGIKNVAFGCADAMALPLAGASLDLAVCGYSLHHFGDAARAVGELARVVRPGGRVALMDLLAPDEPERAAANNEIERVRDASHVTTLRAADLRGMVEAAGLRVLEGQVAERPRSFDDWMQIAGWHLGDSAYHATRRLMEASIAGDGAGFHPRLVTADSPSPFAAAGDIEFAQVSLALVAEKPRA
jgi:ubiquinone/menaquinone biosynthesis C-methylase UbiE